MTIRTRAVTGAPARDAAGLFPARLTSPPAAATAGGRIQTSHREPAAQPPTAPDASHPARLAFPGLAVDHPTPVVVAQALTGGRTGPRTIRCVLSRSSSEPAVQPPLPDPEPAARQPNRPKGHSFGAESRTGRSGKLARYCWLGGEQGRIHVAMGSLPESTGSALWVACGSGGSVAECGRTRI